MSALYKTGLSMYAGRAPAHRARDGRTARWLWTELNRMALPVICIDARHAKAALKMQINKSDRNDALGIARISEVRILLPQPIDFPSFFPFRRWTTREQLGVQVSAVPLARSPNPEVLKSAEVATLGVRPPARASTGDHQRGLPCAASHSLTTNLEFS